MTDSEQRKDDAAKRGRAGKSGGTGTVINASAGRRPRVHEPVTDRKKEPVGLDFLGDIPLKLNVVLATASMPLGEIVSLEADSIVQLEKPSGDPVDILIEDQPLGKGEVIVLHEKLRVRILEVTPPASLERETRSRRSKRK
jgi:flagellar motor switch protein FliN/FliY